MDVVGKTCCMIFICIFKAVASPTKLFHPKIKGYNFQIAFHDLCGVTFMGIWLVGLRLDLICSES